MNISAIIVAAGKGVRVGGSIPKQYIRLSSDSILTVSIKAMLSCKQLDKIVVVINESDKKLYFDSIIHLNDKRLLPYCVGGAQRSDSVRAGLKALEFHNPDKVLIHDAARPFLSLSLMEKIIQALVSNDAVLPILPIYDAIWQINKEGLKEQNIRPGPDRSKLFRAQTPQGFDYKAIFNAHKRINETFLDDIAIAYEAGLNIVTIPGEEQNFKITTLEQLNNIKR